MSTASAAPAGAVPPSSPPVFSHRQIQVIMIGLMSGMLLAALDGSIVGTAMPRIVSDLGGLNHLAWVVTAYLLASTAVTPLWGKISDLYGRRPIFQLTIIIFLIGSALCGLAQTMPQLIAFRAIQGIGGGGLMAIAFAVMGDVIPARERGRYQGYMAAVFGSSSVAGPLLGGWLTDAVSWRWIFYINLPIGIGALIVTSLALKLPLNKREPNIDYLGAAAIVASTTSLLLYLNWAGEHFGWLSPSALAFVAGSVLMAVAFVFIELRAKEPIIPMRLFRNKIFSVGNAFGEHYEGFELPDAPEYRRARDWVDACRAQPQAQQVTREQVVKLYYDYARGAGNGALAPGRARSSFAFAPDWRARPWPPREKYAGALSDAELGLV